VTVATLEKEVKALRQDIAALATLINERLPAPVVEAPLFASNWKTSPTDGGWAVQEKAPGRATLVPTRGGRLGVRLHTEPGDSNVASSGDMERCDAYLCVAGTADPLIFREGEESWWAHSILFPDDFTMPTWHQYIVADFHNSDPGPWQANFMLRFEPQADHSKPGNLVFRGFGGMNSADGPFTAIAVPAPVAKNVWYDFVYHMKWSSMADGYFDAWVNGKRKLAHQGPTLYIGQGVYLKLANYHLPVCDPYPACIGTHKASSVIHDRVVRGKTAQAVTQLQLE
jgi:polysaccharide lyase-like protein